MLCYGILHFRMGNTMVVYMDGQCYAAVLLLCALPFCASLAILAILMILAHFILTRGRWWLHAGLCYAAFTCVVVLYALYADQCRAAMLFVVVLLHCVLYSTNAWHCTVYTV